MQQGMNEDAAIASNATGERTVLLASGPKFETYTRWLHGVFIKVTHEFVFASRNPRSMTWSNRIPSIFRQPYGP